ncbi:MAG: class I SAM-dependent methyltransferase, partial [Bacilli bacterium]|nr:class I SAM-dependent methyltransferase [Bacilli bacterium]
MPQYFDNVETLAHEDISFSYKLFGENFTLKSDAGVFSKDGLDDGSRLLLETIAKTDLGTEILDLGCGVGPIGLTLAKLDPRRHVTLADVNLRALECAKANAKSLGVETQVDIISSDVYSSIPKTFSTIVTNPPIRAGKKVTYAMYAGAVSHLNEGGSLILVIRKQQGAPSCQRYLETLFQSVSVVAQHKGYRILIAKK